MKSGKTIFLAIVLILTLVLSYYFAISKTVELHQKVNNLELERNILEGTISNRAVIEQEIIRLDSIIAKNQTDYKKPEKKLLDNLDNQPFNKELKIIELQEPHTIRPSESNADLVTLNLVLEGRYENMEKFLYEIETKSQLGQVVSLEFTRKKNFRTNEDFLQCQIYFQWYRESGT